MQLKFEILDKGKYFGNTSIKLSVQETGEPVTKLLKQDFILPDVIIDITETEPGIYTPTYKPQNQLNFDNIKIIP